MFIRTWIGDEGYSCRGASDKRVKVKGNVGKLYLCNANKRREFATYPFPFQLCRANQVYDKPSP